jgi:hypothetical protein
MTDAWVGEVLGWRFGPCALRPLFWFGSVASMARGVPDPVLAAYRRRHQNVFSVLTHSGALASHLLWQAMEVP